MAITQASRETNQRQDWATPWPLFNLINAEFSFTLDAAASPENAKCERFLTELEDGRVQPWRGERVYCNPPYGKETGRWVEAAHRETTVGGCPLAVLLVVPRSDTDWWYRHASRAAEIRFLKGRVAFEDPTSGKRNSPQDPSCLLIFRHDSRPPCERPTPCVTFWDWKAELKARGL